MRRISIFSGKVEVFNKPTLASGSYITWVDTVNSVITQSGGTVSGLSDISGNSRDILQALNGNQPAYSSNGLNGKPCLVGDGSTSWMRTNNNVPASLQGAIGASTVIVFQETAVNVDGAYMGWGATSGLDTFGVYGSANSNFWFATGSNKNYKSNAVRSTSAKILSIIKTPGAINTTTTLRVNGVTAADAGGSDTGTTSFAGGPLYMMKWSQYTGTFFKGNFGAMVVTTSILLSDIQAIEAQLNIAFGNIY